MNRTSQTPSNLQRIFEPTPRGVVGLVDDLLEVCLDGPMELDWQADHCRIRVIGEEVVEIPFAKSVFRTLLARIAALCNERKPNSVSPYGGQGELLVAAERPILVQATFTNTPAEQKLVLAPA